MKFLLEEPNCSDASYNVIREYVLIPYFDKFVLRMVTSQ